MARHRQQSLAATILTAAALSAAGISCGANTDDALVGTWRLSKIRCSGSLRSLPSGLSTYSVAFGADGNFTATGSGPSCDSLRLTGRFARSGISISKFSITRDCGTTCTIAGLGLTACTGTAEVEGTDNYSISAPDTSFLEEAAHSTLTFCPAQGELQVNEVLLFIRTQ